MKACAGSNPVDSEYMLRRMVADLGLISWERGFDSLPEYDSLYGAIGQHTSLLNSRSGIDARWRHHAALVQW